MVIYYISAGINFLLNLPLSFQKLNIYFWYNDFVDLKVKNQTHHYQHWWYVQVNYQLKKLKILGKVEHFEFAVLDFFPPLCKLKFPIDDDRKTLKANFHSIQKSLLLTPMEQKLWSCLACRPGLHTFWKIDTYDFM